MRRTLRHNRTADHVAAGHAWLPRPLIDTVVHLKEALAAFRIAIVGDRRPTRGDRFLQHRDESVVKLARAVRMDAPRERQRMNPCAKQRLVGVDVADAPKKALV